MMAVETGRTPFETASALLLSARPRASASGRFGVEGREVKRSADARPCGAVGKPRAAALQDRSPKGAEPFAPLHAEPSATCEPDREGEEERAQPKVW